MNNLINLNIVKAMLLRYTFDMRHSLDRLSDMIYWPLMNLFIWGLTGLYFARLTTVKPSSLEIILTGIILWLVVWRAQYEINVSLLSELWDRNLVNIFASPLRAREWIFSVIVFGILKMMASLLFMIALSSIIYGFNILNYGFYLFPIISSLMITGWVAGFFILGLLIRYGDKIQTLAWTGVALIAPLSAVYYPLSNLPDWAQKVSLTIPTTYIFEGLREILRILPPHMRQFWLNCSYEGKTVFNHSNI